LYVHVTSAYLRDVPWNLLPLNIHCIRHVEEHRTNENRTVMLQPTLQPDQSKFIELLRSSYTGRDINPRRSDTKVFSRL